MSERSEMISWIRGEMIGPARPLADAPVIQFNGQEFTDPIALRRGPLSWKPAPDADSQEVLYFDRESPHRKYGGGLLHPTPTVAAGQVLPPPDEVALQVADTIGAESDSDDVPDAGEATEAGSATESSGSSDVTEDFEVTSPDVRHPSTIGISFCVRLGAAGRIIIRLPASRRFVWQTVDSPPFLLNGRYESGKRRWTDEQGRPKDGPVWRRHPAVLAGTEVIFRRADFVSGRRLSSDVTMPEGSPLRLRIEAFPRQVQGEEDVWLVTAVLRNSTQFVGLQEPRESILYQTLFEVVAEGGSIEKYPESRRPFDQLDEEEQSLALLYRESATWGIGHGCAAGWDAQPNHSPDMIYADVMPAVELPSMTPDIEDAHGNRIQLSMRALSGITDDGAGPAWQSLENLAAEYSAWIQRARDRVVDLDGRFSLVATRHLDACDACLDRINAGIALLRNDARVRRAFRFANLSMLLQQIATKQLARRPLDWDAVRRVVGPVGTSQSPWDIYQQQRESGNLGTWRAFQIAFLLMSLDGARSGTSLDREIVDLIWFPTGGGKTEA